MNKHKPPEAFGVFKPVGHVVMAFRSDGDSHAARTALVERGFDVVAYTPQQMLAQVDADIAGASPLASLGQELNLVKAHRELAERGHSFIVVRTPDDEHVRQAQTVATRHRATAARHYGSLIIEELVDPTPGAKQVFESPARGLDQPATDTSAR